MIRLIGFPMLVLAVFALVVPVAAQTKGQEFFVAAPIPMDTLDGKIVVLPTEDYDAGNIQQSDGIRIKSSLVDNKRFYEVHYKGRTHTASIPTELPYMRLVFNPRKRMFDRLLSSIRVELNDYTQLAHVVDEVNGVVGKAYPQLGYAVIRIKPEVHPLHAVELASNLPGVLAADVRLKGPPKILR